MEKIELTPDQEERIVNCGAFGYNADKISSICGIDRKIIADQMKDKQSQISILIQKGIDMFDYVIELKLFELAKSGDIKALSKLEMRQSSRRRGQ